MSSIVVQKYGGSSVADVEKIRLVANKVKLRRDQGASLVVVVSAMGDTTDELLTLAKKISADPPRRELDMLLTCGERISMALLSMALHELGVPAISFTGSQSGIITDTTHAQARIVEVKPSRIEEELAKNKVVIVAGYQGVSREREVTTLGRGGSDTTAVALAAALGADCEIYSDVDGIFSADPRVVPGAKKLEALSFEEMQELAAAGAKVLNTQAVEFARAKGIVIHARSTSGGGTGTQVRAHSDGDGRVKGVTCESDVWVVSFADEPGVLLKLLDARDVRGRTLLFDAVSGRGGYVVVPLHNVHGPELLAKELGAAQAVIQRDLGTVTCVGAGINNDWSTVRQALSAAQAMGATVRGVYTTALQLTLLIDQAHLTELTRVLHQELVTQLTPA